MSRPPERLPANFFEQQDRQAPVMMRGSGEVVSAPPARLPANFFDDQPRDAAASQIGRSVAQTLGAPVDIANTMLSAVGLDSKKPFLGSESIMSGMRTLGIPAATQEPETLGENVFAGVGAAGAALAPFLSIMQRLGRMRGTAGQIGRTMTRPFETAPVRSVAGELTAGAGAGAGMHAGESIAPDNPAVQTGLGIVGGIAGGTLPFAVPAAARAAVESLPLSRMAAGLRRQIGQMTTEEGAIPRAAQRLTGLAADPEEALRLAREVGISDLPAAYRTGDERLMALANLIAEQDPKTAEVLRNRVQEAQGALRGAVDELSGGDIEQIAMRASRRADERLRAVTPEREAGESSILYRKELDESLKSARSTESALWNQIPKDTQVSTGSARSRYQELIRDLSTTQMDDMPVEASRVLGAKPPSKRGEPLLFSPQNEIVAFRTPDDARTGWGSETSVREAHGLYSRLREIARNARAGDTPNRNRARLADEVADAIWADIEQSAEVGPLFAKARDFTRRINETFRQGSTGRLLGYERTGDERIAAEMAFNATLRRGGTGAAVSADELRRATQFAGRSGANADEAIKDYIRLRFAEQSLTPTGTFNTRGAQTFLNRNRELMQRFPNLKVQLDDAIQAAQVSEQINTLRPAFRQAMDSPNPRAAVNDMKSRVKGDPVGIMALKAGFVEQAFRTGANDAAGMPVLSGRRAMSILSDPRRRGAAEALLSEQELNRMRRIARELSIIERAGPAKSPLVTDILGSEVTVFGTILDRIAQIGGAKLGAAVNRATPGGGAGPSLQSAQMGSSMLRQLTRWLATDKAETLLTKAIFDDELFLLLFRTASTPGQALRLELSMSSYLNRTSLGLEDMLNAALPGTVAAVAGSAP